MPIAESLRMRRGFTLLEIVAALGLGGLVILGARAALDQIAAAHDVLRAAAVSDASRANGARLLRQIIESAEPPAQSGAPFEGGSSSMSFGTWCAVAGDWLERCRVTLASRHTGDSTVLIATLGDRGTLSLMTAHDSIAFRYRTGRHADGWSDTWNSGVALPLAVALVAARDTVLLLPMGEGAR